MRVCVFVWAGVFMKVWVLCVDGARDVSLCGCVFVWMCVSVGGDFVCGCVCVLGCLSGCGHVCVRVDGWVGGWWVCIKTCIQIATGDFYGKITSTNKFTEERADPFGLRYFI